MLFRSGFEPTPNIPFPNLGQNTSTAQISNVKGYQYYLINGIQVAKFVKQFKITDISTTIEGQLPGGVEMCIRDRPYPW